MPQSRGPWHSLLPLAAVLLLGAFFHGDGAFFSWETHRALLREISVHGILACGMTVVILTGGIDLSVGSLLALAAVVFTWLTFKLQWGAIAAVACTLVVGVGMGLSSGLLVAIGRIPPFVVTLAGLVFARGLAKQIAEGKKLTHYSFATVDGAQAAQSPLFELLDSRLCGDQLAAVTLVLMVCAVITWFILARLRIGRYLYAVGGQLEAARLSGVPVRSTLVFAYGLSGFFAATAGLCQAAQETHGDPETGMGYELDAIAMVVLGGTRLAGGRGSVLFTLVGALTLGYLQKILSINAYSSEARLMLTGIILIAAVLLQSRIAQRTQET